jgi:hypothetical protein
VAKNRSTLMEEVKDPVLNVSGSNPQLVNVITQKIRLRAP